MELQLALRVKGLEPVAVFGGEDHRERPHGKEVVGFDPAPALPIGGKPAAGDDAVQVVVVEHRLAPGMQDGRDPGSHAQLVVGELKQRRACALEKQGVHGALVLQDERVERVRQSEDDMEVGHRQEVFLLPLQPLVGVGSLAVRAMPVAAAVGHEVVEPAIGTAVVVRPERRGAAAQDRIQGFPNVGAQVLRTSQRGGNDFCHRERLRQLTCARSGGTAHGAPLEFSPGVNEVVERAAHRLEPLAADVEVARRGREVRVAEQHLQGQQVHSVLQQMRGEAVSQAVDAAAIGQPCPLQRRVEDLLCRAVNHRDVPAPSGREEPGARTFLPVIGSKFLQQPRTEDRVAILSALALVDPQHHASALNVPDFQVARLVEPEPCPVNCHQKCALPQMPAAFQKQPFELLAGVNSWPADLPAPPGQQVLERIHWTLEHLPVKKPQ